MWTIWPRALSHMNNVTSHMIKISKRFVIPRIMWVCIEPYLPQSLNLCRKIFFRYLFKLFGKKASANNFKKARMVCLYNQVGKKCKELISFLIILGPHVFPQTNLRPHIIVYIQYIWGPISVCLKKQYPTFIVHGVHKSTHYNVYVCLIKKWNIGIATL